MGTTIIIVLILCMFFILNFLTWLHPKLRNCHNEVYSVTEDLWEKHPNNKKLLICMHGMHSTPSTFEDFAKIAVQNGWDVYMPSLPASARTLDELKEIGPWAWEESLQIVRHKIDAVINDYNTVVLSGHSQGGSLAMAVAPEFSINALIVIASPISLYGTHLYWFENLGIFLSGLLCFLVPKGVLQHLKDIDKRKIVEKICDAEGIFYPWTIYTFKKGLQVVRRNLHKINVPLFLAYEKVDRLVSFKNKNRIESLIGSQDITERVFAIPKNIEPYGMRHQLLNYNMTRDLLNQSLLDFLNRFNN